MVALVTVAAKLLVPVPAWTDAVVGEIETETTVAAVSVTVADADFVGSWTEVAMTVTVAGEGTELGAV